MQRSASLHISPRVAKTSTTKTSATAVPHSRLEALATLTGLALATGCWFAANMFLQF